MGCGEQEEEKKRRRVALKVRLHQFFLCVSYQMMKLLHFPSILPAVKHFASYFLRQLMVGTKSFLLITSAGRALNWAACCSFLASAWSFIKTE